MAPKKENTTPPPPKLAKSGGQKQKKKWSKGKQEEKVNNMVLFNQSSYDELLSEVPKYKLVKADRLKVKARSLDVKMKAQWSYKHHKLWVELCLELVQQGRRPGSCIDKIGYAYLVKEFNRRTGLNYKRLQMKNHWDRTKGEWVQWNKLVSNTGLEWDPEKKTVVADDEWWANWLQKYPKDEKWREKGLDFAQELDVMFGGTVATCDTLRTPSQGTLRASNTVRAQPTPSTMENRDDDTPDIVSGRQAQQELSPLGAEIDDDESTDIIDNNAHLRRRLVLGVEPPSRRQRLLGVEGLDKQLDRLCDAVESRISAAGSRFVEGATIKECIELLNGMPEVPRGSKLYLFAIDTFLKKEYREVFIAIKLPEVRLLWLEHQMELATGGKQ